MRSATLKRVFQCVLAAACCAFIAPWLALLIMLLLPPSARSVVYRATAPTHLPRRSFAAHIVSLTFYPVDAFVWSDLGGSLVSRDLSQWVGSMRYRAYDDD